MGFCKDILRNKVFSKHGTSTDISHITPEQANITAYHGTNEKIMTWAPSNSAFM